MSLAGLGVVAVWHDLDPAAREDFYEWHNREHLPERVGIPGFRRGRRFVTISGGPEYFTLYEADSLQTLLGQDYANRLNAPSAWTQRVLPAMRNMTRAVCRVAFTQGVGSGGVLLTLRCALDDAHRDSTIDALRRRVLPALVYRKGIAGVHLCVAEEPTLIVLIEGNAVPDVDGAADELAPALLAKGAQAPERAVYRLEITRLTTPWAAG